MSENNIAEIKKNLRSTLLPNKNGLVLGVLEAEYRHFFGEDIPFRRLGFKDLVTFLSNLPDVMTICKSSGGYVVVVAKADESTYHIQEMIGKQKDNPEGYNKLNNKILSCPLVKDKSSCLSPVNSGLVVQSKIPKYLKENVKELLDSLPKDSNVTTDELYRRYNVKFGVMLNVSDFNCSSFVEMLSLVPELVQLTPDKVSRTVAVLPVRKDEEKSKEESIGNEGFFETKFQIPSSDSSIVKGEDEEDGHLAQESLKVYITAIRNPSKIYVQFIDSLAELEEHNNILDSLMNEEDKWGIKVEDLEVNKMYSLKYEGRWFRIKLIAIKNDKISTGSVFFLDYGWIRDCNMRYLKKLPQTMEGESFSIPIRLSGIHNFEDKWSKDSIRKLRQILRAATNDLKSSLNIKVDEENCADQDITVPVWLTTPGGRDLNDEVKRSIAPGKEMAKKDEFENVFVKLECVLAELKNVELTTEEEAFLGDMCLHLEKILECKERTSLGNHISGSVSNGPPKQNAIPNDVNPEDLRLETRDRATQEYETNDIKKILRHDLLNVDLWTRSTGIPRCGSNGVELGIGVSSLKKSNRLVVSCMGDKKLKMFTPDGHFLKIVNCVEAEDGDLTDPSDIVSLEDGGFAVSDKSRVVVFDEDGKFLKTAWRKKDFKNCIKSMLCFGLGQDNQKRLVLLLDNTDKTLLCIIDLQKLENVNCYDVRYIVKEASLSRKGKSRFRFLFVFGSSYVVTDYGNTIYVLKFSHGKLLKDTEIGRGILKTPAGVSADSQGNLVVADYTATHSRLSVFSAAGQWIKNIEVNVNKHN